MIFSFAQTIMAMTITGVFSIYIGYVTGINKERARSRREAVIRRKEESALKDPSRVTARVVRIVTKGMKIVCPSCDYVVGEALCDVPLTGPLDSTPWKGIEKYSRPNCPECGASTMRNAREHKQVHIKGWF